MSVLPVLIEANCSAWQSGFIIRTGTVCKISKLKGKTNFQIFLYFANRKIVNYRRKCTITWYFLSVFKEFDYPDVHLHF